MIELGFQLTGGRCLPWGWDCHGGLGLILSLANYGALSAPRPCQGQSHAGSQRTETPTDSMTSVTLSEYAGREGLLLLTPLGQPWQARWRQHERGDNK